MSSPVPPSRKTLLHLYAATLRASRGFSSYNFRNYFLARTKDSFRGIQSESDPTKLSSFYQTAIEDLAVLKRSVIVNSVYGGRKLVVEKDKFFCTLRNNELCVIIIGLNECVANFPTPGSYTMTATKSVRVEFGGGLEILFSNQKSHTVEIPTTTADDKPTDVNYLIHWLRDNLLKEREEFFLENGTVRPGILVLINDTDWELEGEGDYLLQNKDEIVFISTLHGG